MKTGSLRQRIKPWLLPIAMIGGILFHDIIAQVAFITPYLIFTMLFITFCKVKPNEFKVARLSLPLLAIQIGGAVISYFAIAPFNTVVAQGVMICFLCPTATAAPVVTGMLGGSVSQVASYSIICNATVAILTPFFFTTFANQTVEMSILDSQLSILLHVAPLLLLPMIVAFTLQWIAPKVSSSIANRQGISFYLWSTALFIVVGRAVSFVINEPADEIPTMTAIALGSAIVCCTQFWAGRKIGFIFGDKVAGAQALGQKNTILAMWLALTWLHPLASVGPAAYIAWQNIINSAQIYRAVKSGINSR